MVAHKGKPGTRGQKQILEENAQTLKFYRNMAVVAVAVYLVLALLVFTALPTLDLVMVVVAGLVLAACYKFMASMAAIQQAPDGSLLDVGCDLNVEGGVAEHVKDLVILTSATLILATLSSYFWLLWLLAPFRGGHMLWTNVLGPWFFAPAPEEPEEKVMDKKQLRRERRLKYR